MIRPALSVILGAAFLLGATACSSPTSTPSPAGTPTVAAPSSPASTSPSPGAADVFAAMTAATKAVPGTVVEVGRDREGTVATWEIGVRTADAGVEVYVNRATGEVMRQRPLVLSREQRQDTTVTAEQAIRTAQADTPGDLMELDLGTDRGRLVWEVVVREGARSWEFYIDAQDGTIVRRQRD
ncbi:MAG: PepSY domain-containing protein [Micropruina sp.]|nr:PepSY domain-containing protein [Micropruina sp.]